MKGLMSTSHNRQLMVIRVLIAVVLFFNLQAAVAFLTRPAVYMGGFGLRGNVGEQMVRGMGLLFLMWNIPYAFALADPLCNRTSLIEAVIMQAIGLVGESAILLLGGPYPDPIPATLMRFILFDGGGLVLLLAAFALSKRA